MLIGRLEYGGDGPLKQDRSWCGAVIPSAQTTSVQARIAAAAAAWHHPQNAFALQETIAGMVAEEGVGETAIYEVPP